jgi:protein phosphatase
MSRAFADANAAVIEAGREHRRRDPSETRPTATTLSLVALEGARYFLVHLGDCSVYHVQASTEEATARQVEHNRAAEYAKGDPARYVVARRRRLHNVLTRWMGMTTDWAALNPQVLAPPGVLAPGDALVLCSDGLDKHVDRAGVARAALHLPARAAARRFVGLANDRGGSDHIAVAVLQTRVPSRPPIWSAAGRALWRETAATAYQRSRADVTRLGVAGLAAAVLAAGAALIATVAASSPSTTTRATPTALPTASPLPIPRE